MRDKKREMESPSEMINLTESLKYWFSYNLSIRGESELSIDSVKVESKSNLRRLLLLR